MPAALTVQGVTKRWRGRPDPVLDAVDLTVQPGELVRVVGDNGTGKTTLLRVIAGLLDADAGHVTVEGVDPREDRAAYARRLGLVSAGNAALHGRLTARQHLAWAAAIAFVPRAERADRIASVVRRFALEPLLDARSDRISMGQRQRVRLALAFLGRPRLLLLDEPRTSLDEPGMALLAAAVGEHRAGGGAAVWCAPTGEPGEASASWLLRGGKLVAA